MQEITTKGNTERQQDKRRYKRREKCKRQNDSRERKKLKVAIIELMTEEENKPEKYGKE